jgi:small subunit ribosomal protein S7
MRRRVAKKHLILPDPRFDSVLVTSFVNNLMLDGKKSVAFDIFYKAMDKVEARSEENGLEVFQRALENVTPAVEVRSRRVGGATFQIPQPIRDARKQSLAMKWLISFARKRNEKSMSDRLAAEVLAASKEEGATFKKKEDTHRMAEANKAFSHFRF